ncbi:transglycosylase SLT domain-containing protein [Ponticaulis profundi]|uniref:Transglycosylase SLT domain-containing protein n=1 Tax=Ponticaulis profundi TaxID=2665222 RepID=A0ABW1SFM5_9PROT
MLRFGFLSLVSLFSLTAFAQDVLVAEQTPDTLACQIFRDRSDWYEAAKETEIRWGLTPEHQLALFAEEWALDGERLPPKWRPTFTLPAKGTPGLPAGFFEATWQNYKAETGQAGASPNEFADLSDFMGWYFARTSNRTQLSPFDSLGVYYVWKLGPRGYATGAWQSNMWIAQRANRYAERVRLFRRDLEDCGPKKTVRWFSIPDFNSPFPQVSSDGELEKLNSKPGFSGTIVRPKG